MRRALLFLAAAVCGITAASAATTSTLEFPGKGLSGCRVTGILTEQAGYAVFTSDIQSAGPCTVRLAGVETTISRVEIDSRRRLALTPMRQVQSTRFASDVVTLDLEPETVLHVRVTLRDGAGQRLESVRAFIVFADGSYRLVANHPELEHHAVEVHGVKFRRP